MPVFDAANLQQNLVTAAQTLKSNLNEAQALYNQVQQLAGQVQQIRMEAQNLVNYPASVYNELRANVEFMRQLTSSSEELGTKLSQLSSRFSTMYPGYNPPSNYTKDYTAWASDSLGQIKTALDTVEKQMKGLATETQQSDKLRDQSAQAVGQMQVLQSANQISSEMVQQLRQLRELQAAEMSAQNVFMAGQVQDKLDERRKTQEWLKRDSKPFL